MKKLHALRDHLIKSVPGLKNDPDRLLTFIEDGQVEFHRGQNLSHEYRVPARIILTDHQGDLDTVMIPLLQWLSHYNPGQATEDAVRFQAEILSNHAWDLAIDVTITERVIATVNCEAGRIDVDHRMPEFPIEACPATAWQLFIKDANSPNGEFKLVAEWSDE